MHEENLHITPDPGKSFPKPEIPAGEAWDKMAGLLDAEMPVSLPDQAPPPEPTSPPAGGGILGGTSVLPVGRLYDSAGLPAHRRGAKRQRQ